MIFRLITEILLWTLFALATTQMTEGQGVTLGMDWEGNQSVVSKGESEGDENEKSNDTNSAERVNRFLKRDYSSIFLVAEYYAQTPTQDILVRYCRLLI